MADGALRVEPRPDPYRPPRWHEVERLARHLRDLRQPVIDRIWEAKKGRRGEWEEVVKHIPASFRKMLVTPDQPLIREMIDRVVGMIAKSEPVFEVVPPSSRQPDISAAAKEELRLHSLRMAIEDSQNRPSYALGIDAQAAWGESWIAVVPDPEQFEHPDFKRKEDEKDTEYIGRYQRLMAGGRVPIRFDDYDPQTVLPAWTDRNRLGAVIVQTEHVAFDVKLGHGYRPKSKSKDGKLQDWTWVGKSLGEGYVPSDGRGGVTGTIDMSSGHDNGGRSGEAAGQGDKVQKTVYMDCWCYQMYLDGELVEQWEHNYGVVPVFPAYGGQSSDRDPAWQSAGIADVAISIAKQVVMFSAILASNAMQHGFPTPFLKNPAAGLIHPVTGQPLSRAVQLGEMNLLGPQEDITFPYLDAKMMPDFFAHMQFLMEQLESSTLSNFGKAVGSEMAGYAIAQIRAMQNSKLGPIYANAKRQWRSIAYFLRHVVKTEFPEGIAFRGAIDEDDEGNAFQPILEYGKEHTTEFSINVHIEEGIPQDETAGRKLDMEQLQAGIISRRRAMERAGVEDPAAEMEEIDVNRIMGSPAADQLVLTLAQQLLAERYVASRTDMSSPFYQHVQQLTQQFMGGEGQMQNQAATPMNATGDGTPVQQQQPPATPLEGGPQAGPKPQGAPLSAFGIPQMPGGVKQAQTTPGVGGI